MQHIYDGPRAPIDAFEVTLINAFTTVATVDAIWVREVQAAGTEKKYIRSVWLQLCRRSPGTVRQIESLVRELKVRTMNSDFELEVHFLIDELPPAAVAPSCVWRRDLMVRR